MIMRLLNWWDNRKLPKLVTNTGFRFTDHITGKPIYKWIAEDGTVWLAENDSVFSMRVSLEELDYEPSLR